MLRVLLPASVALAVLAVLGTASPAEATTPAEVRTRLHAEIGRSTATSVSVAVDVEGVGRVYRQGATTSLKPASTEKLFTALTVLEALGPAGRLRTELRTNGTQRGPYLQGDLYLVAGGDPYLSAAQLDGLAAKLRSAGIRRVDRGLVVDDTRHDSVRRGPAWPASYVPDDSGPLSALALDGNAWRKDAAYLKDPALPTLERFKGMLAKHGITVVGALHRGRVAATSTVLASHPSASVQDVVRRMAKDSDNFAAEVLLKEAGKVVRGTGSTAAGVEAAHQLLSAFGVAVGGMVDGSGLSPSNRQTAEAELALLTAAQGRPTYAALRRALPVACVDGTLEERMCGTAAQGRAVAKTGTLPGVHALTGWTTTSDGRVVRYAVLLSGTSSSSRARAAIDACIAYLSSTRFP